MTPIEPALFYTGMVARIYRPLRGSVPDGRIYGGFIKAVGQPALELGCGDGDPLLDLVARGYDVEGLDSSPDMVARCRAFAAARGLEVVVHEQRMEQMDLGRRYQAIYLAGATFNLLADDDVARAALERIAAHLVPGGAALIPLFIPELTPEEHLGVARSVEADDGSVLRCSVLREERDEDERTQVATLRYEIESAGDLRAEDRRWLLHWYTQEAFRAMVDAAGLAVSAVLANDGSAAAADATNFTFWLTKAI